ncbi:E3 ubiquitin ligase family protein [Actinomadura parmotrematis]|uniref:E3 ubiquitin ligase family protein n=1 Tax=Actinomadura parmotrematis TaxID=2864039 RepID=A0ABS7FYI5_9ACTN|nr:E3 ubiquitin ligase family protein [Actinomadura parmotrematis]MBW8485336.1 E3 ubiquitin ligase family protein [Actinomadura parmotrematis]
MEYVLGIVAAVFFVVGWVWRMRWRALGDKARQVTGAAYPGPSGPLRAPFSGAPCVWYKVQATAKTASGKRTFVDERSREPFVVGGVLVDPHEKFVDGVTEQTFPPSPALPQLPPADRPESYSYKEWILPPGLPLTVLNAEAQGLISTRDASGVRRRALKFMAIGYGTGGLLLVLAIAYAIFKHVTDGWLWLW